VYLSDFKPYKDKEWSFEIFNCSNCGSRFAMRNPAINYYEMLHSGSSYRYHFDIAAKVKHFLKINRLDKCEHYLKKAGYKYSRVIDFIREKSRPLSILEIGCSTGFMTAFLRASGHDADGIDISEAAISHAKSTFGPFYSLSPSKTHYDLIFHVGVIGCVENPKEFLGEYLKLLKPEGEMIFNAPNVTSPEQLNELWVSTPPPDLIYLFSEKSFQYLVNDQFNLRVGRVYTRSESIKKNIKVLLNIKYNKFPVNFHSDSNKTKNKVINFIKNSVKAFSWSLCEIFYPLRIFREYENEYGFIVTINKKLQGGYD
jgi:SAM-dependent methyltransferase